MRDQSRMTALVRIVDAAYIAGYSLHRIAIALNRGNRGGQIHDELTVLRMIREAYEERTRPPWWWVENNRM
jgi:myo-inositol catabolism protein IolC